MNYKKENIPSKKDIELMNKLKDKGFYLLNDLKKVFSYKIPEKYSVYVPNLEYSLEKDKKVILDIIFSIQKYNRLFDKLMKEYEEKKEENKNFDLLYEGYKDFNDDLCGKEANNTNNLVGNLINKYERKHITFNSQFLQKNIFKQSGLLPTTKKQAIDFYEMEIHNNGQNSIKSLKCLKFIEKLYDLTSKLMNKMALKRLNDEYGEAEMIEKLKRESILQLKKQSLLEKEIKDDINEIKRIKNLIDIITPEYNRISNRFIIKEKRNSKIKSLGIKTETPVKIINKRLPALGKIDENTPKKIDITQSTTLNYSSMLYKAGEKNINSRNQKIGRSSSLIFLPSNSINILSSPKPKHNTSTNQINKVNPVFKIFDYNSHKRDNFSSISYEQTKKSSESKPKLSVPIVFESSFSPERIKPRITKKKTIFKSIRLSKRNINRIEVELQRKKKIPEVYEKLKDYKSLMKFDRRNIQQREKINDLFKEIYDAKKVDIINDKKATKELYNTYCNLRESIRKCRGQERLYNKYKLFLDNSLKAKLEKSFQQDEELKHRYYDFMHIIIREKVSSKSIDD